MLNFSVKKAAFSASELDGEYSPFQPSAEIEKPKIMEALTRSFSLCSDILFYLWAFFKKGGLGED